MFSVKLVMKLLEDTS